MLILNNETVLTAYDVEEVLRELSQTSSHSFMQDVLMTDLSVDFYRPVSGRGHSGGSGAFYGIGDKYYWAKDQYTAGRSARFDYYLDSVIETERPPSTKFKLDPPADKGVYFTDPDVFDAIEKKIMEVSGDAEVFIHRDGETYKVVPARAGVPAFKQPVQRPGSPQVA
jgi:hypothetical protein